MRSCWIDKGDNPDPARGRKYAFDRPVFDIRDETLSTTKLLSWRQTPPFTSIGVFAASSPDWNKRFTYDPEYFAEWIHQRLIDIAPGTGMRLPCVSVNIEKAWVRDYPGAIASYATDFSHAWRERRTTRVTTLVLDGMQGGWWDNRLFDVAAVEAALYEEIQVEAYGAVSSNPTGGPSLLAPIDTDAVCQNLRIRGFTRVVPMHDGYRLLQNGAVLGDYYGGIYTQGRLQ